MMMGVTPADGIAYTLEGPADRPVLMLSNSLGTTMAMWENQAAALRTRYRILRYDTRGHGGSAVGTEEATLAQLGRDALSLLDRLKLDRVHFCGISMGGLIGLWLGVHAGHRLQRLVVANSAAKIGQAEGWHSRAAQVAAGGMEAVADGAAARWFTPAFIARAPKQVAALTGQLGACPPAGYAACCLALAHADLRDALGSISTPTLVIAGRDDPVTTLADARTLCDGIPGARYAELAASHLSNVEASAAFNERLRAFLA